MSNNFTGNEKATTYGYFNSDGKNTFICTYHNTQVFKFDPTTKKIILNSGGYFTVTTKKRINQCFNFLNIDGSVYQKDSIWYCLIGSVLFEFTSDILEINGDQYEY